MGERSILLENLAMLSNPDNFQKYVLGTKGNGDPRAIYDVVRDYTKPHKGKGHKHKHKDDDGIYSLHLITKKKKKKHKKKKKKDYWHI